VNVGGKYAGFVEIKKGQKLVPFLGIYNTGVKVSVYKREYNDNKKILTLKDL